MEFVYKNGESIYGLNNNFSAMYIDGIFEKENKNILVVAPTLYEAQKMYDLISMYSNNTLFFPVDDFITSLSVASSPEFKTTRIETLNNLVFSKGKNIVVTHLMGYLKFLSNKNEYSDNDIELSVGSSINRSELLNKLDSLGYKREISVLKTGDISVRGFVIDIFPISFDNPIRIEFFGDEIESIRYFDVDTQRSIEEVKNISIFANEEGLGNNSLYDYMDNPIVVFKDYSQLEVSYNLLLEEIANVIEKGDKKEKYMFELGDINPKNVIHLNSIDTNIKNGITYKSRNIDNFNGDISKIRDFILGNKTKKIVLVFNNKKNFEKFNEILDVDYSYIGSLFNLSNKSVDVLIDSKIKIGGVLNDLIILSSKELFGIVPNASTKSHFKRGKGIKDYESLKKGDFVVHEIHGVGKYDGVVTLEKSGIKKDYLLILYNGTDKLYIPVEKIDYISKFSGREGVTPKLNRLGSGDWEKTKNRIREKVKDIAEKLIKINALRQNTKGFAFLSDTEEQILFESKFEYILTTDQAKAISEIKEDMEKPSPMDRLLCGDVGYGKTEVAFRAMFKAVMSLKQVAYLCPTTILCKQQYENAINRFAGFGLKIVMLNRFTSSTDVKNIIFGIEKGDIDIVFGTHRLLSDDVKFKDLGLLVIDEEQRFGVMHKEKIKEYKANIDILTLSATPIPRTMQMSMTGIKSMSLIETPPEYRTPIQTYVIPESKAVVRDLIYKELSRKGQVFVLYNRVDGIIRKAEEIGELVPEARITYAHGQMTKVQLENKMNEFILGENDVLVCTTIIETGIDIPNVNTLIIYDSDKFGLSQLYQIRGRVGRSDRQAYAYLFYKENKVLTESAVKRLEVIKNFTELGSGLSIAMRDLSIRGAGDILGSEQAGFIDSVGIDLYIKILNEEVNRLNGVGIEEKTEDNKPLVEVNTHISDDYSNEEEVKLEIHRKINEVDSLEKIEELKVEIKDRFGLVSDELEVYMYEEWFEKLAKNKIEKIIENKNYVEVILNKETSKNIDGKELFLLGDKLNKHITFEYKNETIRIKLSLKDLKKHYIYLLVILFNKLPFKKI